MPRPKKTEMQLEQTRAHILEAAYAILQEAGPQALTSRAIAERLGIAHMSLFHDCFENQAAILSALREREVAKIRLQLQALEQLAASQDILAVLREALLVPIRYARENPNLYYLAWVMPEAVGENQEQGRHRLQATVQQLAHLIQMGMEQGQLARRDPMLAAVTVLGMVNMPVILFYSGKLVDPDLRDRMLPEALSAALGYLTR